MTTNPKWTLVSVGRQLGVTNTTVRHLLNGVRYPSLAVMRRIERAFGWSIVEQIQHIPDLGYDNRYADEFRYWLGERCEARSGSRRDACPGCGLSCYRKVETESFAAVPVAQVRAALRLISPDHITPMGARIIEKVLDAAEEKK
jgi:Helix-turn-helix